MKQSTPERLTPLDSKNQHLYFTTPSATHDGRWLVIISERSGAPNLWAIDLLTGHSHRISNAEALQYSYVYAEGGTTGFCKVSPALDPVRNRIYWVQDDVLWQCQLGDGNVSQPERIASIPPGGCLGFSHVSDDGRYFAIPKTPKDAFDSLDVSQQDQMENVPRRMLDGGLKSKIFVVDIESGKSHVWAEIPFWVTHVQFSPTDNTRMIFNSEGSYYIKGDAHTRVWTVSVDGIWRKLFHLDETEEASHENWSPDGTFITSHGWSKSESWVQAHSWDGACLWREPMSGIHIVHATCLNNARSFAVDDSDG